MVRARIRVRARARVRVNIPLIDFFSQYRPYS